MTWIVGPLDVALQAAPPFAWLTSLDSAEDEPTTARAALAPADYADFAGRADAASRLARRRLVKELIAGLTGLDPEAVVIGRSTLGAPLVVRPEGWRVSLSGRWPWVAIGVARGPVGVDLERLDQDPPPEDAFTPAERERIADQPSLALALWTAKEAHAKSTGRARHYEARDIATRFERGELFARCRNHASRCLTIRQGDIVATLALPQTGLD